MAIGAPAAHDIFTDSHRWGDLDEWNRSALALLEQGPVHRIEREGFDPFWAVETTFVGGHKTLPIRYRMQG